MNAIRTSIDQFKNSVSGRRFWKYYCALPHFPLRYRYGSVFCEMTTNLKNHEFDKPEQMYENQLRVLKDLVRRAYGRVAFYRKIYDASGCHPDDIRSLSDFRNFPTVNKAMIRQNIADMVARGTPSGKLVQVATSGSSGEPLAIYWEAGRSIAFENAFLWHYYSWHGIEPSSRKVQLRGYVSPNRSLYTYARCNTLVVSCEAYGQDTIAEIISAIRAFRSEAIFAFPSNLLLVSKYIVDHGLVGSIRPRVIVTSSERLYPEQEALARQAFECPVMDLYGNTELTVQAIRCPYEGMHFNPLYGYTEIDASPDSVGGEIISTGFSNLVMPLLRYRTGDYAEADTSACECGRHWPRIGRLLGKDADYLIRSDGTEVTVNILWALHVDMGSDIHEFQVCQEKPGHVEFRYVADMNLDVASERLLLSKLADIRGLNFSLRRVSTIKRGPRGKYQMVLQALPTTRSQLLAEVPKSNAESAR